MYVFSSLGIDLFVCCRTLIQRRQWHPRSSTLAWKIPWMEEPGRLQSMGSLGVGHDGATSLSLFTFMHWRRKWQSTPVFLPGESQGRESLVGCRLGVAQSRTWLTWLSGSSILSSTSSFSWVWKFKFSVMEECIRNDIHPQWPPGSIWMLEP